MDTLVYLLCWARRRVWLVGPFCDRAAVETWTLPGAPSNKRDDPRWHKIEPTDETRLMFTGHTYAPSDPVGYLRAVGWEHE